MTQKNKNHDRTLLWKRLLTVSVLVNILLVFLAMQSQEPYECSSCSVFSLTATQIVHDATQRAVSLTARPTEIFTAPTLYPTLTSEEEIGIQEAWLDELEIELGYSHPILEKTVDELVESLKAKIDDANETNRSVFPIPDSIIYEYAKTSFDGADYVAIEMPYTFAFFSSKVFIFRIENDIPELIFDSSDMPSFMDRVAIDDYAFSSDIPPSGFIDRNGNDFPDISISFYSGGSHPIRFMKLYEISSDSEFLDLTEDFEDVRLVRFVDLDKDGILEFEGIQEIYTPDGVIDKMSPFVPRWVYWNGESYELFPLFTDE